jgi:hypothetical protein
MWRCHRRYYQRRSIGYFVVVLLMRADLKIRYLYNTCKCTPKGYRFNDGTLVYGAYGKPQESAYGKSRTVGLRTQKKPERTRTKLAEHRKQSAQPQKPSSDHTRRGWCPWRQSTTYHTNNVMSENKGESKHWSTVMMLVGVFRIWPPIAGPIWDTTAWNHLALKTLLIKAILGGCRGSLGDWVHTLWSPCPKSNW